MTFLAPGTAAGTGDQPTASKTGKYIAPGLREGAANRRGETMPRPQRGIMQYLIRLWCFCVETIHHNINCCLIPFHVKALLEYTVVACSFGTVSNTSMRKKNSDQCWGNHIVHNVLVAH